MSDILYSEIGHESPQKKSLLITDSDLDGVSCAIVGKMFFRYPYNSEGLDIMFRTVYNYKDAIKEIIDTGAIETYNTVYVTDLSIDQEIHQYILDHSDPNIFQFIDHHQNSLEFKNYPHYYISTNRILSTTSSVQEHLGGGEYKDRLASASRLFYEWLSHHEGRETVYGEPDNHAFMFYVEMASRYDTWEWANIERFADGSFKDVPKQLNDLYYFYGKEMFMSKMMDKFYQIDPSLSPFKFLSDEWEVLEALANQREREIRERMRSVIYRTQFGLRFAIVYSAGRNNISEFARVFLLEHPEVDVLMQVDIVNNSCQLRTHQDNNINVAELAECYGGGGHIKASGFPIREDILEELGFLETIFYESSTEPEYNMSLIRMEN